MEGQFNKLNLAGAVMKLAVACEWLLVYIFIIICIYNYA